MKLDPRLKAASFPVTDLPLCHIRLHENAAFPWVLLIPQRENAIEIIDLSRDDQHQLMEEIRLASHVMQKLFTPTKLNVGNLGNIVPQLHIHMIARFTHDPAWPHPVWGHQAREIYDFQEKTSRINKLHHGLLTEMSLFPFP